MPLDKALSPIQLWNKLVKDAGLELRLKNKPGRDADLEQTVLKQLDPGAGTAMAHTTVKALLKSDHSLPIPKITVEKLLTTLLATQQGFSAMLTQILETLIMAQATVGDNTLEFAFEFDSITDPLKLTLEQFRAHVERTRQAWVSRFEPLNQQQRWSIFDTLSDFRIRWETRPADDLPLVPQVTVLPTVKKFQKPLLALEGCVTAFLQQCRLVGRSRVGNFDRLRQQQSELSRTPAQKAEYSIAIDATDFWDVSIADSINFIKQGLHNQELDLEQTYETVMRAVSLIPVKQQWVEERYQELLDILNLPTWKRRHELYSVWVGTQLINVAKAHGSQLQFYPHNKVLSFAFGGSLLATYVRNGERFSIHCELRSDLVGTSRKRKRAIQPDFRVLRDDLAATTNDATRLVLECKHYLRASTSNFSDAASDYARSCTYASVLVVNHGSLDETVLLNAVDPALRAQARFIGDATPNTPDELCELLRMTLFSTPNTNATHLDSNSRPHGGAINLIDNVPSGGSDQPQVSVCVEWDEHLQDIDLALTLSLDTIDQKITLGYMNRGGQMAPFYAELMEDIRNGPGAETINIYQLRPGTYDVVVKNYSHPGNLPAAHLHGRIIFGATTLMVHPPESASKSGDWRMATLQVNKDGAVVIHT